MTTNGSGAVFFLGTRAHYQVLQQPESHFDVENGNASSETIYQNTSVQELWSGDQTKIDMENKGYVNDRRGHYDQNDADAVDNQVKMDDSGVVKRHPRRRPSETTLCERDVDIKPTALNNLGDSAISKSKSSKSRMSLLSFLTSLAPRKRPLDSDQIHYLHHIESALNSCTYRESCRCLDCQSRYFECDESDEYSSDDSDYVTRYFTHVDEYKEQQDDDDDEVFLDIVPGDNTSTDMLLDSKEKMSVSSDEGTEEPTDEEDKLDLEVVAGTPVLLNYLLTHPITCAIQ